MTTLFDALSKPTIMEGEKGALGYTRHGLVESGATGSADMSTYIYDLWIHAMQGMQRDTLRQRVREIVLDAVENDKLHIIKDLIVMIFETRDIRGNLGGKGWRQGSYWLYFELMNLGVIYPNLFPKDMMLELYGLFSEYGSWRDYKQMYEMCLTEYPDFDTTLLKDYTEWLWVRQLQIDLVSDKKTLVAKYAPKYGDHLDKATDPSGKRRRHCGVLVKKLAKMVFPDLREDRALKSWRQMISGLNRKLDIVEVKMCNRDFKSIVHKKVPGRAMRLYKNAYLLNKKTDDGKFLHEVPPPIGSSEEEIRNWEDRMSCRSNLLEHISGAKSMNSTVYGYELLRDIVKNNNMHTVNTETDRIVELQWNRNVEEVERFLLDNGIKPGRGLGIGDFSGSMYCDNSRPILACGAAMLMLNELASRHNPTWSGGCIAFSEKPSWIPIDNKLSFGDRVRNMFNEGSNNWGMTTDYLAVWDMILERAIMEQVEVEDMVEYVLVATDMQFDSSVCKVSSKYRTLASLGGRVGAHFTAVNKGKVDLDYDTTHNMITEAFRLAGLRACGREYKMPLLIYYNLRGDTTTVATRATDDNTFIISGYNEKILKMIFHQMDLTEYIGTNALGWETYKSAIYDSRYDAVRKIINKYETYIPKSPPTDADDTGSVDSFVLV